ncbi:S41 family peptidase [Olleya sp. ITB9]|uniref:S41 family peptidase n=1 Tax=Olleya sp. ITB9 TaxID=1715648 RepID=UPI0006D0F291|nr:S41 family peptidase [Olleya sp. ITB9]
MKKANNYKSYKYKIPLLITSLILLFCSCKNNNNIISIDAPSQEFNISNKDSITHDLKLIKDKFYSFTIYQKGIDVVVYLMNSKNEILQEKNSPNGSYGSEQFYFYCENQDEYKLLIKPLNENKNTSKGKYTLAVSEVSKDTKITLDKSDYLKDFNTFKAIFEKANSGLYRYYSKQEVDSVFSVNKNKINNKTTYQEFYNLVWNVIDYTGSCHNNLRLPKYLKTLLYRKDIFFPIPIKYIDGKLYSNINYNNIPAGAEILSVNGIKATDFSNQISKYRSTDGINQTSKYNFIQTNWAPLYIYHAYGEKNEFNIIYKYNTETTSVVLKSINFNNYLKNYNKRHSKVYDTKVNDAYQYRYIDSLHVGVLSIKSFDLGEKGNESFKKYELFLDSVFISLKDKKNLIVDIRGNGGGSGDALMLLTSYLSNRSVKENIGAYTLFNKIPFPEFYIGSVQNNEKILNDYVDDFKNGKYYQNSKFNPLWKPNKNNYKEHFILLIDPFVASAASHFAAHIKSDKRATIIGEETGGAYYGHTGHFPVLYILPNSKLELSFSVVNLEQDVIKIAEEKFGNGVIPDIEIVQNHEDFMENKDTQLNFAFDFVKKKTQK